MNTILGKASLNVGVNCVLTSLANIISDYNKIIDDSVLFFIQNGFNTTYARDSASSIADIKLKNDITRLGERFLNSNGIDCGYRNWPDDSGFSGFVEYISNNLCAGNNILVVVDSTYLRHNAVYVTSTRRQHILTITGIEGKEFTFIDYFVPAVHPSTYIGNISFDSLRSAWESAERKYIHIDFDKLKNTAFEIDNDQLLHSLKDNLRMYLFANADSSGLSNLYVFADDIADFTDLFGEEDLKENLKELSFKIQFEGILPSRILLRKMLLRLENTGAVAIGSDIFDRLNISLEMWRKITLLLVKASFKPVKCSFERISSFTKETIGYEKIIFEDILLALEI